MKLYNQRSEIRALKTICNDKIEEGFRARLLAKLTKEHFHYPPTKAAFARVASFAKKRSKILDWNSLLEDGSLDEEFRSLLETSELESLRDNDDKIKDLYTTLHKYKTLRGIYELAEIAVEEVKKKAVDSEELLNLLADKFTNIRQNTDLEEQIIRIGNRNNSSHIVKDVLYGETEGMIRTGIPSVDDRNGGLPLEGVHLLAGTTSGGKSTIAMQLLMWIHKLNKMNTLLVSMEMGERQVMQRMLSNLSNVLFSKIKKKALSKDDESKIKQAYKDFKKFGIKNECSYDIMCPIEDVSSSQLFLTLQAYNYSVVCIDYISLFSDAQKDDQWKALSEVARQAKIFSRRKKCLVIILAQLDSEDDRIRYSKGVLEHADAAWTFNYSKPEVRETHVIPIKQVKMRDGELFPFDLKEEYHFMRVSPMDSQSSYDNKANEDDILSKDEATAIDKSVGMS
jgi:replicative DNA helicase